MKLAIAVRVVGLAVILLGTATTERFHHPEQSRQPAASQPSIPSTDEPHKDIFNGPPPERRAGLRASMTMTNGLPGDAWSESRRGVPPSAPDYAIILMVLVAAGTLSLTSRLANPRAAPALGGHTVKSVLEGIGGCVALLYFLSVVWVLVKADGTSSGMARRCH